MRFYIKFDSMKWNLMQISNHSLIFIYLLFSFNSSTGYSFWNSFLAREQTKITIEDCKTTVEINGKPDSSEQISISTHGCQDGKPSGIGLTHIISPRESIRRPTPRIYPIQLLISTEQVRGNDLPTETIGSLTQLEGKESIFVSSLHGFRHEIKRYNHDLFNLLKDYKPILFRKAKSNAVDHRRSSYDSRSVKSSEEDRLDLVVFVKNSIIDSLIDRYDTPFQKLSESKEAIAELRAYLSKEMQPYQNIKSGDAWISPRQMGLVGPHTAEQDSQGTLSLVVPQTLEVYLAPSEYNFSTSSSSGSVIFSQSTAKPIGVISCQMNQNLVQNGVQQNINGTYRILTFELIREAEVDVLESVSDAIYEAQSHLSPDPTCDWRDIKFGGGP